MTATIEDIRNEITILRNRVDEVSTAPKTPWYKNISTIIAIAAFLFSFSTTLISYKRTNEQDIRALRNELRSTLQRLALLPKENLESYIKYKDDSLAYATISGFINQENLLLLRQANDAIRRLPKSEVSATDYYSLAQAMIASRNFENALPQLQNSLDVAADLDDEVSALRLFGALQMSFGRVSEGRQSFQRALEIFASKYPRYDDMTKAITTTLTEIGWANSEAQTGNLDLAGQHLTKADQAIGRVAAGPGTDIIKSQVAQTRNLIFGQRPSPALSPFVAPPATAINPALNLPKQ